MKRLAALGLVWVLGASALAQAPAEEAVGIPGVSPGVPPAEAQVADLAREIGLGLRCPVCQGLSVADSTSSAAVQMQDRIRELVAAGYSREQIEAYFVSKYGEWVLLAPPAGGMNQIVWLGPLAAVVLGLAMASRAARRREEVVEDEPDTQVDDLAAGSTTLDPHRERLLHEVDDD